MLKTISFQKNYNGKLDNAVFTTIRKKECGFVKGDTVAVVLADKFYKWVQIIDLTEIHYVDIPHLVLATDTGITDQSVHGLFKVFGMNTDDLSLEVSLLLCKSIPRPHEYGNPEAAIQFTLIK